ncbi:MAG: 4Fe-4S dicluster domain-containing protein, partial [Gammaproteobacteria bacterium]
MTVDMQRFEMFRQGVEMLPQMAQPTDMPAAERLAKVKTTFRAKLNANMAVELESCVHCGQCAEACHFYNATQDPKYTPIRKLDLLKRFYRREVSPLRWIHQLYTRDITIQELEEWQELVYDSCTECGRCFMVCPMGINIASMVNVNRQALANAGMIPPELRAMEQEQYNGPTLFNMGPEQAEGAIAQMSEQLGIDIPLNKDKAEVMLLTSVVEVMIFNDQLIGGIKVL